MKRYESWMKAWQLLQRIRIDKASSLRQLIDVLI